MCCTGVALLDHRLNRSNENTAICRVSRTKQMGKNEEKS